MESRTLRRKVRKGTHSCWNCKRRKVKCTYAAPEDPRCISCHRRGKDCISQENYDSPAAGAGEGTLTDNFDTRQYLLDPSFRANVADETSSMASNSQRDGTAGCPAIATTLFPMQETGARAFPLPTPNSSPASGSSHEAHPGVGSLSSATDCLIKALPSQHDLRLMLQKVCGIHLPFYASKSNPGNFNYRQTSSEATIATLYSTATHPVLLGRQILLLVVATQHCPIIEGPEFTESPLAIITRLADAVRANVTSNDLFIDTIEGIDNLILEACYYTNSGNMRRAWMTMRRAIMAGQLVNLQYPGAVCRAITENNGLETDVLWPCTVTMERIISMMVGLPTSTSSINVLSRAGVGSQLPSLALETAGKIIARNELHDPQQAIMMTQEIDRELINTSERLPAGFWRPSDFSGLDTHSEAASKEIQRAWDHLCYQTIVNQLHLPYFLYSTSFAHSSYSRNACIHASREILQRHIALRTFNPVHPCCHMGDFMAVVAAITLVLSHILSHATDGGVSTLMHQRSGDRATIERSLDCNTSLPRMSQDVLLAKCVNALRELLKIEEAARGRRELKHLLPVSATDHNMVIIRVPDAGVITIARNEGLINNNQPLRSDPPKGFSTGGIGFLHVDRSATNMPDFVMSQTTYTGTCPAPINAANTCDAIQRQEEVIPPISVNMDDWVFQGFDASFFDVIMRGNGDHTTDRAVPSQWPAE